MPGAPYGTVPYGGVYPPGQEPALNATFVSVGFSVAVEPDDPLETALGGDPSKAEFAVILRPWFLGDDQ